ncbi:hypothetical protein BaRGS_00008420 [Batillaria attramentaria]|uniref:DUF4708 domain-containing protein n=1 Tax=Batillaria attramentaria TaxID=370345 RepID=A0ABD0LLI1_9CAEN
MLDKLQLEPILLFASKPDLDELCTVTVRVDQRSTGVSPTQPRVLKCRETIFTEPGVMASPSPDFFDCFNVVMPQSLYKTGRLQTRMKNNQLQVSSAFRATPSVYQACLHYTMLARLAPLWNKAGDWLIQGRDFLGHTGCASAIKFDLVANTQELYISLADLNLSPLEVQSLLYNASRQAGEVAVPGFWCHVLPSMKKGRLCSVSLSIPADSPFTSYRDLKRHWKNTYGYRLPETDDDIFYGQISFWATGGKQFTYPSVCLRAGPIQPVPRVEPRPILSAFLQDLHVKLPSVCGQPVKFQPQLRHTCAALYPASQYGTEEQRHPTQTRNPVLAETGDTRAGPTDPSQAVQSVSTYHAVNKPHVQGSSSTDSQVGERFVTKTRLYESTAPRLTKRLPVVTTGTGAKSAAPSPVQVVTAGKEATCPALSPVHVVTAGKGATFAALSPVYARPVDSQVSSTVNKPDPPRLVPVFKPRGSSSKKKTVNDDDPCKPNAGNSTKIIPTFTPEVGQVVILRQHQADIVQSSAENTIRAE